jgi:hypothetical protein
VRRDGDHTGIRLGANKRPEMPDVLREYDPVKCYPQVINNRIFDSSVVEIMINMLEIKGAIGDWNRRSPGSSRSFNCTTLC